MQTGEDEKQAGHTNGGAVLKANLRVRNARNDVDNGNEDNNHNTPLRDAWLTSSVTAKMNERVTALFASEMFSSTRVMDCGSIPTSEQGILLYLFPLAAAVS